MPASVVKCRLCGDEIYYNPEQVWMLGDHLLTKHRLGHVTNFAFNDDDGDGLRPRSGSMRTSESGSADSSNTRSTSASGSGSRSYETSSAGSGSSKTAGSVATGNSRRNSSAVTGTTDGSGSVTTGQTRSTSKGSSSSNSKTTGGSKNTSYSATTGSKSTSKSGNGSGTKSGTRNGSGSGSGTKSGTKSETKSETKSATKTKDRGDSGLSLGSEGSHDRVQLKSDMKRVYQTTVETWKQSPAKTICHSCGRHGQPLIRKQQNKIARTSLGALCLLGCWPICFLPFIMGGTNMMNLYCRHCGHFLGTYDRRTGEYQKKYRDVPPISIPKICDD